MTETHPWREAPTGDYAVVGDPVAHSKSPAMHAAAYRALGLNLTYRAIHVPRGELGEALDHLRTLGYRGVNCTVPHKEAAFAWARQRSMTALETRMANTLHLPSGAAHNTDVMGFMAGLALIPPETMTRTLILGAGGSAAAVISNLLRYPHVALWNRNPERAERLLATFREHFASDAYRRSQEGFLRNLRGKPGTPEENAWAETAANLARVNSVLIVPTPNLTGYGLVVNATPTSLTGEDLGLNWSLSAPDAWAYDLAYGVDDAPFLRGAREAGRHTIDGREMLARQGYQALLFWADPAFGETVLRGLHASTRPPDAPPADLGGVRRAMREALDEE